MFVEERELLVCRSCGLVEEVAIGGILLTYFGERDGDTGLRLQSSPTGPSAARHVVRPSTHQMSTARTDQPRIAPS